MLEITIPSVEEWDELKQEFVYFNEHTIQLEHSLVSLSKWEAKWHKAFLKKEDKTYEETLDYVRCMTLTPNVSPNVYQFLTEDNIKAINEYIETSMTATYIHEPKNTKGTSREPVTSELIYYWMIALNIPFECQYWHLSRLLTLVRVCNIKNKPPKKHSRRELMSRNSALNKARRQRLGTKG